MEVQVGVVRALNSCLAADRLRELLSDEEIELLAKLVESGRLVLSVDCVGFHVKADESGDVVHDCGP